MNHTTYQTDLVKLARGEAIEPQRFASIIGDPAAREELARLRLVADLFDPSPGVDISQVPGLPVSVEQFVNCLSGREPSAAVNKKVAVFLDAISPALSSHLGMSPGEFDTRLSFDDTDDTRMNFGTRAAKPKEKNDEEE